MLAIQAQNVSKTYRSGTMGLRGIDLEVREGEVFCLVGPNGAGKTTLMRILGTQLIPSGGTVRVLGLDLEDNLRLIRARLACVPQGAAPNYQLRVWEHVYYFLVARGVARQRARRATGEVLEGLGLHEKSNAMVSELSGGMRRRVLLGIALASGSDLLLLDEPTSGLDLLVRRQTWNCLASYLEKDATILMSTHSMEEAEALADRVGIVNEGAMVAIGKPHELRALAPGPEKVVIEEGALPHGVLRSYGMVQSWAGKLAVFPREREGLLRLLDLLIERKVEASVLGSSLEDAFVHLVGNGDRSRVEEQP